jgi:hypothetical protein
MVEEREEGKRLLHVVWSDIGEDPDEVLNRHRENKREQ